RSPKQNQLLFLILTVNCYCGRHDWDNKGEVASCINDSVFTFISARSGGGTEPLAAQGLPKVNHPLSFRKSPGLMSMVCAWIFNETAEPEFIEALRPQERFYMGNEASSDGLSPVRGFHPNTFEKGHRLALAAICSLAQRYFREALRCAVGFGDKG